MSGTLSLCMIVRDEEAVLPRCLASVTGVVDELVVVDTGSVDATPRIAREHGATVLHHPFPPVDYSAARNLGLAHATGSFVLVLDADETLAAASVRSVRARVDAGEDVAWVVARRNHVPEAPRTAWVDHAVRLFPNRPEYRFRYRVHETVDASVLAAGGRLGRAAIAIDHFLPERHARRERSLRYLALLADDLAAAPDDVDRLRFLAAEYHKLGWYEKAIPVAERVCVLCPGDFDARLDAALYHFAYQRDPAHARQDLVAALAIRPHDPEALALLAAVDAEAPPRVPLSGESHPGSPAAGDVGRTRSEQRA